MFVYLVKPLAAAERDGDRILAVIAGTAVNTAGAADGATGSGPGRMITAPTRHAQASLMRAACARAGLAPVDVDYIEAHATGTRVGDRIEGNAIGEVFGGGDRAVPLRMASVKTNVGHMEAAAFTCALLKVLLMFEHRTYAPVSGHFAVPSPDIDFTGLRVQTESEPFGEGPVTVGINSFGFGGANGHCLLTEYRPDRAPAWSRPPAPDAAYLVPLSARTPEALAQTAAELRNLITPAPWTSSRRTCAPRSPSSTAAGPHMALTPSVRHCLAGRDRPPACVRTLGRDEDSRLPFHQALGALYRAGVPLDFAARYPRPRPASHLLPPHPKDEHPLVDDARFLRPASTRPARCSGGGSPGPSPASRCG